MSNPHPCALFWGKELTVVYNEAYAKGMLYLILMHRVDELKILVKGLPVTNTLL